MGSFPVTLNIESEDTSQAESISNNDLMIDTSKYGVDAAIALIKEYVNIIK